MTCLSVSHDCNRGVTGTSKRYHLAVGPEARIQAGIQEHYSSDSVSLHSGHDTAKELLDDEIHEGEEPVRISPFLTKWCFHILRYSVIRDQCSF